MQISFLMNPSAGNISGQKNFKRLQSSSWTFFDESFWVRVPWGKGRAPAFETRQFHTRFIAVSSETA